MHANYIGPDETEVKGEAEVLLPPYSGLQIESLPDFNAPVPSAGYYTVVLKAMQDNISSGSVSEEAPLATWH